MTTTPENVARALRELADGGAQRSMTARLADCYDDIEAALARGVRRDDILMVLRQQGLAINMQLFQKAMSRLRKRRANSAASASVAATPLKSTPPNLDTYNGYAHMSAKERREAKADKYEQSARTQSILGRIHKEPQK